MATITGTHGWDSLSGSTSADTMVGLGGNDWLDAREADDLIRGGSGSDTAIGFYGNDTIRGGPGDDDLYSGHEQLFDDGGRDLVFGGSGDDRLYGFSGDTLAGGAGSDILYIDLADVSTRVRLNAYAFDRGRFHLPESTEVRGVERGVFFLGSGDDRVHLGETPFAVNGGTGNDTILGGFADDNIAGGPGDDRLSGGEGRDLLNLSAATEAVTVDLSITHRQRVGGVQLGSDIIRDFEDVYGSIFYNDTLIGGAGTNVLSGSGGYDVLKGGDGDDTLYGFDRGNYDGGRDDIDHLYGGHGRDYLYSNGGDYFVFENINDSLLGFADQLFLRQFTYAYIDLSRIDADITQDGDQSFTVVHDHFSRAAGELLLTQGLHRQAVRLDVDGDGQADAKMAAHGDDAHLYFQL